MSTYKITNITNRAGKRDSKFNSNLDVEYVDNMMRKSMTLKPGNSLYLTVAMLPLSIHRLRMKNLVIVEEVSATELTKLTKPAPQVKKEVGKFSKFFSKNTDELEETSKKSSKKKLVKKDDEE